MSKRQPLLFQVGQLVESRSFITGFRGAWFRCEIKEVAWSKGQIRCRVQYYDYDADGLEWLNLHEVPKISKGFKNAKRELMLRPQFPPIYHESELLETNAILDVAVVVDGGWSVGDMVDWWEEGCYWFGTITKIYGNNTVEVKLPDEPVGEGQSYVASYKDLRPSLNWSPDSGWTFPESQNGHSHARLIQPVKQAQLSKSLVDSVEEGSQNTKSTPRSVLDSNYSISSRTSASSLPLISRLMRSKNLPKWGKDGEHTHGESMELDTGGSAIRKPSSEISVASSAEKKDPENVPAKNIRVNEPIRLNSTSCDSIESAIMDLEELVCRVKWLKQILKFGRPSTSNKWEFREFPTVSEPK